MCKLPQWLVSTLFHMSTLYLPTDTHCCSHLINFEIVGELNYFG